MAITLRRAAWLWVVAGCVSAHAGEVVMHTEVWDNTPEAFERFDQRIRDYRGRNLLGRKGVAVVPDRGNTIGGVPCLHDGDAGERGGEGRANVNGSPSVVAFYLGQPKPITQVGVFSFNGDRRANQDFEVRFADNSANPGKLPQFPEGPHLTSGDKILGRNGGGFHTWFVEKGGGTLVPGKADWVEFRLWRTYSVEAGQPAKTDRPNGWSAIVELEVFGDEGDVVTPSKEELDRRAALKKAPRQPAYEKKATWQETMIAAREGIVRWETELDLLVAPDAGVTFGPWHLIGPFAAGSKEARETEGARRIDLAKGWRQLPELKDGAMAELARPLNAKPGEMIFLCRTARIERVLDRQNPFAIGLGLGAGRVSLLPHRRTVAARRPDEPAAPNQVTWALQDGQGDYQVLAALPVAADGTAAFWFTPQPPGTRPGAGSDNHRIGRREALYEQLKKDFPDPVSVKQIAWEQEDSIWIAFERRAMSNYQKFLSDWVPGNPLFLVRQYTEAADLRRAKLEKALLAEPDALRASVGRWLEAARGAATPSDVAAARARYYALATVQEAVAEAHRVESMRLAVEDQRETFGERYPKAAEYLARIAALAGQADAALAAALAGRADALAAVLGVRAEADQASSEILLANPLLVGMDKLLLVRGGPGFTSNWSGPNSLGSELVVLSPVRPDGEVKVIHTAQGSLSNFDLRFDAAKILYSNGRHLFEVNADGTGLRQITNQADPHVFHYDPCYLPDGNILFVSTACEQAVPCTGQWYVGNIHLTDAEGRNERRITFDQDHSWNPTVLNNGRVVYTRWEYTDTPHYFSRLLFHMNPDGTEQMEYYGSNSYWPNAMYWPRPIPGHPTAIACIVSGHHGVGRMGEFLLLDPAKGRQEADGVVQRIPGRGQRVEPIIEDGLVSESWPRFAMPCPLAEPETNLGAGKYFLVTCKLTPWSPWGLYLVDVFDNMTPLLMGGYSMATPLRPRPRPPVIPPKVDLASREGAVYMVDIYSEGNLKGYPRGSIKALRVGTHHYRYGDNGDTYASSHDGGWDVKRILGTAPVYPDGSAHFLVPANTPIFIQPLDAEGKAVQTMRSWFTAMPGETLSCTGCHERQNTVPRNILTEGVKRRPVALTPWHGPARGFSFDREVQPVLDRRCAGCHDEKHRLDLRAKRLHKNPGDRYSPAYINLARYVRRAGYEADYHLAAPAEWEATTSHLVQMLKKGHNNVQLTPDEWERLYAWIDFNVPYPANWRESHRPPTDEQVERRAKYKKLHANLDDQDEAPLPLPEVVAFEPPAPEPPRPAPVQLDGWPLKPEDAARLQRETKLDTLALDLGSGVTMTLVPVPAGRFVMGDVAGFPDEFPETVAVIAQPFYIGQFEVTNEQYAQFDPAHDSAYMDGRGKDRFTRGYPVNEPRQPVIRVTWHQAMAFCDWLSRRTGQRVTLPTEAQWEWACRAGTATPWSFGAKANSVANFADASIAGWNWGRCEPDYSDGRASACPAASSSPTPGASTTCTGMWRSGRSAATGPTPTTRATGATTRGRASPRSCAAARGTICWPSGARPRGGAIRRTSRSTTSASAWWSPPSARWPFSQRRGESPATIPAHQGSAILTRRPLGQRAAGLRRQRGPPHNPLCRNGLHSPLTRPPILAHPAGEQVWPEPRESPILAHLPIPAHSPLSGLSKYGRARPPDPEEPRFRVRARESAIGEASLPREMGGKSHAGHRGPAHTDSEPRRVIQGRSTSSLSPSSVTFSSLPPARTV